MTTLRAGLAPWPGVTGKRRGREQVPVVDGLIQGAGSGNVVPLPTPGQPIVGHDGYVYGLTGSLPLVGSLVVGQSLSAFRGPMSVRMRQAGFGRGGRVRQCQGTFATRGLVHGSLV
jgi:hypothetical protein